MENDDLDISEDIEDCIPWNHITESLIDWD
jgi:hypothetical protein